MFLMEENGDLEQFLLLCKTTHGRACMALIQQVLSHKKIFVFGELLQMPNLLELRNSDNEEYQNHYKLLELFAYGTFSDYKEGLTPSLTPSQKKKLQQLTIVSLAQHQHVVPYAVLMKELDISTVRALEDLIIETIYMNLIQGKIDQQKQCLIVKSAIGRDIRLSDLDMLMQKLMNWSECAEQSVQQIEGILSHVKLVQKEEEKKEIALSEKFDKAVGSVGRSNNNTDDTFFMENEYMESPEIRNSRRGRSLKSVGKTRSS